MNRQERRRLDRLYPGSENHREHLGSGSAEAEFDRWLARQPKVCECGTYVEVVQWETSLDLRSSPWCSTCQEYRGDIFVIVPLR